MLHLSTPPGMLPATSPVKMPTKQQLSVAKRKVRRHLQCALEEATSCSDLPNLAVAVSAARFQASCRSSKLPFDVIREIFKFADPDTLLVCAQLSQLCFAVINIDPALWKLHILSVYNIFEDRAHPLQSSVFSPSNSILPKSVFCRAGFLALVKHMDFYLKVGGVVQRLEQDAHRQTFHRMSTDKAKRSADAIYQDTQELEALFESKLKEIPWRTPIGVARLQLELGKANHPAFQVHYPFGNSQNVLKLDMRVREGFFSQICSRLEFLLRITFGYPHDAPSVICLSRHVYHPNLRDNGDVLLPPELEPHRALRNAGANYIMRVMDALYGLFTESKYLTDMCNF